MADNPFQSSAEPGTEWIQQLQRQFGGIRPATPKEEVPADTGPSAELIDGLANASAEELATLRQRFHQEFCSLNPVECWKQDNEEKARRSRE